MGACSAILLLFAVLVFVKIDSATSQMGIVYLDYPSRNSSVQFLQRSSSINITNGRVNVSLGANVRLVSSIHVKIIDVGVGGEYLSIHVNEVVPVLLFQVGTLEWRIKFRFAVTLWDIVRLIQSITYSDTNPCPRVGVKTIQLYLENTWATPLSGDSFALISTVLLSNSAPSFFQTFNDFHTSVSESSVPAGVVITNILLASDPDPVSQLEGQLSYSIDNVTTTPSSATAGTSDLFRVDPDSGRLWTQVSLDHESVQRYIISIRVSDGGCPSLSDTGRVTVSITDENDNAPVLLAPDRQLVTSSYPVELDIAKTINVTDADTSFYKMKAASIILTSEAEVVKYSLNCLVYIILILSLPFRSLSIIVSSSVWDLCN